MNDKNELQSIDMLPINVAWQLGIITPLIRYYESKNETDKSEEKNDISPEPEV